MRDDQVSYVVLERDRGGGFGTFLLGALVGAGLALLLAPKSGAETQEELRAGARKLKEEATERVRQVQEDLEGRLDHARAEVQARMDGVKNAVETGRQAARQAREELERRLEQSKAAYQAGAAPAEDGADPDEAG